MKNIAKLTMIVAALAFAGTMAANASGRKGGHRSGDYNSHGKGSHYYGGHSMLEGKRIILAGNMCRDGSYSNSSGSGTCSHHGGER